LNPNLKVIAPIREWKMSREEALDYAKKHGIPVEVTKKSPYSIDENLWGRTAECGVLEDPWQESPPDVYERTVEIKDAPDEREYLEIGFEKGMPVSLNGCPTPLAELIQTVDEVAGHHGFGRIDMIENRLVGIKSREIYEVGGALALIMAHRDLEDLTLERDLLHFKTGLEQKAAELVYYGLWYSPLKQALDAFIEKTQEDVSGSVRLKLHKGSCRVVGRRSDQALYDYRLATYEKKADEFGHDSAKGFIDIWGLPTKVWAKKKKKEKRSKKPDKKR
jgi:argininosuccinate synthase